jgi:hypothetical protein
MGWPRAHAVALAVLTAAAAYSLPAASASASATQESVFEVGPEVLANPAAEFERLRVLGVDQVRLFLPWLDIAPDPGSRTRPKGFNGSSPAAYPAANWAPWDALIESAGEAGISVDLDLAGRAPLWAMPKRAKVNAQGSDTPNASEYRAFVQAVGKRYSGNYEPPQAAAPLPRVSFWSVWNEPDYISSLQPQGTGRHGSVPNTPHLYRDLVDAAWKGLHASGHGADKLIIGELAPRGYTNFGPHSHGGMFPVTFIESMYCVDSHYRELRGSVAAEEGCPTNAAGSRRFRAENPGLFGATGFSVHPYSRWYPPNRENFVGCKTGLCTALAQIGNLTRSLDKTQHVYGSSRKFPIYSTEYGYQTSPPKRSPDPTSHDIFVSPTRAALYINQAEYLSYKNPRIASYDQYLLFDPEKPSRANDYGSFASGLLTWDGGQKADYDAFRLPLYMPTTTSSPGRRLEVWGDVRPAPFASADTGGIDPQTADLQFQAAGSGAWTTVRTIAITNPRGYFDVHLPFTTSGSVRLAYTYPADDPSLSSATDPGTLRYSRTVHVTVR